MRPVIAFHWGLITFHFIFVSAFSTTSETYHGTNPITPLLKDPVFIGFVESVGGLSQFAAVIDRILGHASSLCNVVSASLADFKIGGDVIIVKICFADDNCWAVKFLEYKPYTVASIRAAKTSMTLVEKHFPYISIPCYRGFGQEDPFLYYFSDWIEGNTLYDRLPLKVSNRRPIKLPNKVVTGLVEFVYNLITCAIPKDEG
jgi:hypothetical protein